MKLHVFQRVSAFLLAGMLGSLAQAQVPDIPANVSGTYTLTYAFAGSGSPFTNGTVKTFVLNGTTDTMCVDGVSLGTGYFRAGAGSEMLWNGGDGTFYALSLLTAGGFSEINVYSPSDAGNNWKGQFPGPGSFSSSVTCGGSGGGSTPTLATNQKAAIALAATLYPDLFTGAGTVKSAQGYTYQSFSSGVSVGFKDGLLYVAGGPFGSAIQSKGTVAAVMASLQNLKSSISVTPTADMTNLFTLAAELYPSLFGGTGTSFATSADGYLYRYFANSGIYAAIKNGSVYVKGCAYGNAYTSVGALNAVLSQLNTAVNGNPGGGTTIPSGNYNLAVTGTVTVSGFASSYTLNIANIPAPDVSDHDEIEEAFNDSLTDVAGLTVTSFSYDVVSSTANLVEFNITVSATIVQSGFSIPYSYKLNYKYTK